MLNSSLERLSASNPRVNKKLVNKSLKALKRLRRKGLIQATGYRLGSPFSPNRVSAIKPELRATTPR